MTDISNNITIASSDRAIMKTIGEFVKHHRLQQNKTQSELAIEAGIARSTLSLFEKGENTSMIVFIQILRSLKLLNILQEFQIKQQISPIQLAKLEKTERIRARRKNNTANEKKSDW